MSGVESLVSRLTDRFMVVFGGGDSARVALAPGRVNLIGEHTDYNDGWALPMAIDRHVGVAFRGRDDRKVRVCSAAFDQTIEFHLDDLQPPSRPDWSTYVAGVAWALDESGRRLSGLDAVVDGDLPFGAGLSSSAALELAVARAFCAVAEIPWQPLAMAELAQRAENAFVGVSCGLMDQMASALAEKDHALLLDFRTLQVNPVAVPEDVSVVVMDTGARRALADSAYNERRGACEQAVREIAQLEGDVTALRDVDEELLERAAPKLDRTVFRRAKHVVEENARPAALATALADRDFELAGSLMDASHRSLRDLYEVSGPELDRMSELARRHPACFGARLTGAGFGGCAVALVGSEGVDRFVADVAREYDAHSALRSRFFVCRPAEGARLVDRSSLR